MALNKQDDHAGSGIDRPAKRGLLSRVWDSIRRPAAPQNPPPAKSPAIP